MASGLSIVIDTRNAEQNIKSLGQALERLETQGNSIANMMRNLGGANPFAGLTTSITQLKDGFNDFAGSTNTAKTAIKNLADGFTSAKTAIDNAEASLRQFNQTAGANGLGRLNGALTAANNSLNQTNNTIHNTQNNFTQLNNNVNLTRNSLTALSSVVTNNTTVINNYNQSLNRASASAGHANGAFEQLNRTLSRLQTLATGGIMGGMLLSVAKTADAMQGLENQVRLVTQGEEQREEVQRRLLVIANKNFADIEATTGSYQRNAFALAQLGKSQMDVLNFTDALSLAMRTGGRSMVEQKSAVYQLSQAMGAGKLMGDEFRALSENAPIILKYIAKEMGVAQGALKELGSEGKITSEIIYNAMMKARPEMEKMAQSLPITMSQAWQQVNNSYKTFIDNFMNGTGGMSQGIASMLQGVGKNFDTIIKGITIAGSLAFVGFASKIDIATKSMALFNLVANANPFALVATAAIAAGSAVYGFGNTIDFVSGALGQFVSNVTSIFGGVNTATQTSAANTEQTYSQMFANMSTQTDSFTANATATMNTAFGGLSTTMSAFAQDAQNANNAASFSYQSLGNIITAGVVVALGKYIATALAANGLTLANAAAMASSTVSTLGATAAQMRYNAMMSMTLVTVRGVVAVQGAWNLAQRAGAAITTATTGLMAVLNTRITASTVATGALRAAQAAGAVTMGAFGAVTNVATVAVGGLTGIVRVLGNVIKKHPLMVLASVLFGVVASTEGLEGAMKSLGDAIGIVGGILGDFVNFGVKQFGNLLTGAIDFTVGFFKGSKDSTFKSKDAFKDFFGNTEKGFVGMLQQVASVMDGVGVAIAAAAHYGFSSVYNMYLKAQNLVTRFQNFIGLGDGEQEVLVTDPTWAASVAWAKSNNFSFRQEIDARIAEQKAEQNAANYEATKGLTSATGDLNKMIDANSTAMKRQTDAAQASADAQKELAKEQKALLNGARLVGVSGNTGRSTGAHLDIRVSGGGRRLTDAELARFQAGGKNLSAYTKTSEYGSRVHPVTGKRHTHGGIDFKMPEGTPITTKVAIKDIKSFYDSKGGGYVQRILFADGLSVDLLHQSPKAQGIKGGASTGISKLDGMMSKLDSTYEKQAEKALKDQEQNLAKAVELRKEYGTKAQQIEADLAKKLEDIRNNTALSASEKDKFSTQAKVDAENELAIYRNTINQKISALLDFRKTQQQILDDKYTQDVFDAKRNKDLQGQDLTNYLENLKAKYDFDTAANTANLQKQRSELDAYLKDERQLLVDNWDSQIDEARLKFDELSDIRIETLKAQKDRALEIFDLEQSQKLLDLQKFNMADIAYFEQTLRIKNDLVDRSNATQAMKDAQKAANEYETYNSVYDTRKSANDGYMSTYFDLYGQKDKYEAYKGVEDSRIAQNDAVQKALDAGIIQHEEYYQTLKDIDAQYVASKQAILVGGYQSIFGSMTSLMSAFGGGQSRAYRIMANIEKGYALYSAFLSEKVALSKAWASAPFPQNLVAVSKVALESSSIIGAITAFAPKGFSTGGYTGNMGVNDIAGVVHGKEYVLNAAATKRIGVDNLNAMNKGASIGNNNVSVNVVVNADGSSDVQANAQMGKQMGDAIKAAVLQTIAQEKRQGGLLAR